MPARLSLLLNLRKRLSSDERRSRYLALLLWPLAALGFLVVIALPGGVCLFQHVTGTPCPLCGGTHALLFLVEGEPRQATSAHPLVIPLVALAIGHTTVIVIELISSRRLLSQVWASRIWLGVGVILVIVWLARLGI